jgi:hypothetical protein
LREFATLEATFTAISGKFQLLFEDIQIPQKGSSIELQRGGHS